MGYVYNADGPCIAMLSCFSHLIYLFIAMLMVNGAIWVLCYRLLMGCTQVPDAIAMLMGTDAIAMLMVPDAIAS